MPLNNHLKSDTYRLFSYQGMVFKFWIHVGSPKCLQKLKSRKNNGYLEMLVRKCILFARKKAKAPATCRSTKLIRGDGFVVKISLNFWKLSQTVKFNYEGKPLSGFPYQLRVNINLDNSERKSSESASNAAQKSVKSFSGSGQRDSVIHNPVESSGSQSSAKSSTFHKTSQSSAKSSTFHKTSQSSVESSTFQTASESQTNPNPYESGSESSVISVTSRDIGDFNTSDLPSSPEKRTFEWITSCPLKETEPEIGINPDKKKDFKENEAAKRTLVKHEGVWTKILNFMKKPFSSK